MTLVEVFAGPCQPAGGGAACLQGGCRRLAEVMTLLVYVSPQAWAWMSAMVSPQGQILPCRVPAAW